MVEFLDGAGHTETCVAIFQLMFELNLNIPENIRDLPFPDKLDFLSAYWSGYQPKFGESKWIGWKEWVDVMGNSMVFVEPWTSRGCLLVFETLILWYCKQTFKLTSDSL